MDAITTADRGPFAPSLFDPETYFKLDLSTGVMRTRSGTKCCTLTETLFKGLHRTLGDELGPAWSIALRRCGETWGTRQAERFLKEVAEHVGQGLDRMPMSEFNRAIEDFFAIHGWGKFRFDYAALEAGVVQVEGRNSMVARALTDAGAFADALMEGMLKALFSKVTGQDLDCVETECVAKGASRCRFVIGLETRLEPVVKWRDEGLGHGAIVERLMRG